MGVTGLWRLIEPAGKPVPVETLENKVLAVDISIWLHQMVKGYQDAKGAPLPNAHLMGLFQRLCKLLYFRIKPVFVFDGGFPELKRETIAKRQDSKAKYHSESERLKREIALLLSKKTAVSSLLGKQVSPTKRGNVADTRDEDMFKLPALPEKDVASESESDEESSDSVIDLHSVDVESDSFKNMPIKEKYELLIEMKETRKMNSWGKLHELPKKSDNFSDYQMQRLLKRRKVQECFKETEKEMGDVGMSLNDLESLLNEEGIETKIESLPTRRIASDNTTRILMINDVKQALAEAKQRKEAAEKQELAKSENDNHVKKDELVENLEKAIKMSLECNNKADTSACTSKTDDSWTSILEESEYSDSEDDDGFTQPDMSCAKAYILQYTDLTHKTVEKLIARKTSVKSKPKLPNVDQIIEELKNEKSVIVDNVDLSSSDDDCVLEKSNKISTTENNNFKSANDDLEIPSDVDITQASVVHIENPPDIITLDTSTESPQEVEDKLRPGSTPIKLADSDSSEGEFEEVPEVKSENRNKPVVELTLDMVAPDPKDDIFADIFVNKSIETSSDKSLAEIRKLPEVKRDSNKMEISSTDITSLDIPKFIKNVTAEKPNFDYDFAVPSSSGVKITRSNIIEKRKESDVEFQPGLTPIKQADSDSSEGEFEEVPELEFDIQNKPVVEITLNMAAPDPKNDIFADVSADKPNFDYDFAVPSTSGVNITRCEKRIESAVELPKPEVFEDWDADLQKAIQMSLECIAHVEPSLKTSNKSTNNQHEIDISPSTSTSNNSVKSAIELSQTETELNTSTSTPKSSAELTLNDTTVPRKPISTEELNSMAEQIETEEQDLLQEKGRLDRIGRNITEQMTKEAQELLQIFGIPYIVAPMEAEAQCAFLESVNLTDGTITDDSDIWLFGGRTVYKNFFNQKKHVLQFLAERIERSFNLTREQLVLLALLVGSDYTTGVTGVGPVTALEILASFPFNKKQFLNETSKQARYEKIVTGLQEFKKWIKAGRRTDNVSLKKKLKNVNLTDDFPSIRVVQAYLEPNVEKSDEQFSWGEIDITVLRDYAKAKFGWSQNKLDEIVMPVLKRIKERKSQKSVQDYFKRKIEFQSLEDQMSKRVKAAVQKMGPEELLAEVIEEAKTDHNMSKPTRKRKVTKKKINSTRDTNESGPTVPKLKKTEETDVLKMQGVTVVSQVLDGKSTVEVNIIKTDRFQEMIPQREKEKQGLLQNKLKAIEIFRKTKLDKKRKTLKRRANLPKEKAELSESSDSN